jgi:Protein of unknown function (DUF1460)
MSLSIIRICLFFLSILVLPTAISAQKSKPKPKQTNPHERIFNEKMRLPRGESLSKTALDMGKSLLGSACPKYVTASEMEEEGDEAEVELQKASREYFGISLKMFDCMTLVEAAVGMAQAKHSGQTSFGQFKNYVRQMRYVNGAVGYSTRLHYFTDWLYENEKRGLLTNISREIGGIPFKKDIHFMSQKRDTFYGNMRDPKTFAAVRARELAISSRPAWYIPKDDIASIEAKLQDGDIIAITNAADGMDIAHTGFVFKHYDRAHMLHADLEAGRVSITMTPLANYLAEHPKHTGVMIARLR